MAIHIASAPVSWGILEFTGMTPRYTYQNVLDEIKAAGYTGTELGPWGYLPTDPDTLRAELDQRALKLLSAFVPVRFADKSAHAEGEAVAVRTGKLLAALGCKIIVLADDNGSDPLRTTKAGSITSADGLDDAGWQTFSQGVDRVAQRVMDECGLAAAFHHHCAGWIETPAEVERLLNMTSPERVGLCFDTGHYAFGGGNPSDAAERLGGRINHLHFKDCDPRVLERVRRDGLNYMQAVAAGVFPELGKGSVDFPAVIAWMKSHDYDGWGVVEQDILPRQAGSPLESARRNRQYLQTLGL